MRRPRGALAPVLLEERLALKRSMDSGEGEVVDPRDKRSKSLGQLVEDCDATFDTFNKCKELGSGFYGDVRALSDVVVAKLVACGPYLIGNYTQSPFRSEQCEGALLSFLWSRLVDCGGGGRCISPHIVAPLGPVSSILAGSTHKAQAARKGEVIEASAVFFLERATRSDMRSYLGTLWNTQIIDLHLRVLLFQICYTLEAIFMRWPQFRHNDLHDANILLHQTESQGHVEYMLHGRRYLVPRIGVMALISDFDFACIGGQLFDNYKALEQDWDSPSYNINARIDQSADLYTLIANVRVHHGDRLSAEMLASLEALYPEYPYARHNSMRKPPFAGPALTVRRLFAESTLFDAFSSPAGARFHAADSEHYSADLTAATNIPPTLAGDSRETRCCPLMVARDPDRAARQQALPSYAYFAQCPPINDELDAEPATPYAPERSRRMLQLMRKVYAFKACQETANTGYALNPARCDECMQWVQMVAQQYIDDYYVPLRWWPAVFTAAFADVTSEMQLYAADQRCWYIGLWVEFWRKEGVVTYTEIGLLHFVLQWSWQALACPNG